MHLIDYYASAGYKFKKKSAHDWNGPCPKCGGDDRFIIYRVARRKCQSPELGSYSCRPGSGCDSSGDIISFLMEFMGKTYPEALEELGLDNPQSTFKPRKRGRYGERRQNRQVSGPVHNGLWHPQPEQHKDFVEHPDDWREHAEKFVLACHEALLARPSALEYLADRGVSVDLIRKFRLGFNAGQVSKTKGEYQPAYRQAQAWGMPNLRRPRDNSLQKTIAMTAGLTIPCYQSYDDGPSGHLLRINIRPFAGDYRIVKGSLHFLQAQIIINPGQDVALVVESEFDGIALSEILPDVTIICMGSAGGVPGKAANKELRHKQLILLCLDRDKSKDKNIKEFQAKYPGVPAPVWVLGAGVDHAPEAWFKNYKQCQPWYCPTPHKDPGDAIKAGCDMASWFAEGVAYYSVASPRTVAPVQQSTKNEAVEVNEEDLLAFAVFYPEHASEILRAAKNDQDTDFVCRLYIDSVSKDVGCLLTATEGELLARIQRILIAGVDCWAWSGDPDKYFKQLSRPVTPDCAEWAWLVDYLIRRKIDINVIEGEASLVFVRNIGQSKEGELERVSAAMVTPAIADYLSQAKDGVFKAECFK